MPIHSPAAGVIEELLVEDGATVQPGKPVFKLRVGAAGAAKATPKGAPAAAPSTTAPPPSPPKTDKPKQPPTTPPPTPSRPSAPISASPAESFRPISVGQEAGQLATGQKGVSTRSENRVKMNRMRLRIAQRLKDAQNTYAMLTTFNEIDMR